MKPQSAFYGATAAWAAAAVAALSFSASICAGAVLQVRPDGSGLYPTIQSALDASVAGDVIELANGTFIGAGNRDLDYHGKAVTVRSASGDPRYCVIDCQQSGRGAYFHTGEGPNSILREITIIHGQQNSAGAIYFSGASPRVLNCVFAHNSAAYGGALYT
jgi:hypothetical protein